MTDKKESESLGEALPREMTRVRHLITIYEKHCPQTGAFAIGCMNMSLDEAQKALAEGDTVAMIRIYQDLKAYKE